jgi:hypothetical protein
MLELRRDQLPPALDLGHRFFWEGATYQVKSLGGTWVTAERVIEPRQKPVVAPATSPPAEVMPAVPPAAPEPIPAPAVQEVSSKPIIELAPAIGGEERPAPQATVSPDTVEIRPALAIDAEPIAKPAEAAEIADIPAEHDLASKADVAELAARLDAWIWMVAATMAGTVAVLCKALLR